jgi:hypothetical protein
MMVFSFSWNIVIKKDLNSRELIVDLNIDFTEGEAPERRSRRKHRNHDSDTESDVSVGQASIELASSHSSDEDDEFDIGPSWEKQLPKNKKIGQSSLFKTNIKKKKEKSMF